MASTKRSWMPSVTINREEAVQRCRLEHHRVAEAERRRDLPGGDGDRKIPRRDEANNAKRLARDLDLESRTHRGAFLTRQPQRFACEKRKNLPRTRDLADSLGQ